MAHVMLFTFRCTCITYLGTNITKSRSVFSPQTHKPDCRIARLDTLAAEAHTVGYFVKISFVHALRSTIVTSGGTLQACFDTGLIFLIHKSGFKG